MSTPEKKNMKVALFVTCLVDLNRPSVGFAAVKLLEAAGCTIMVPEVQTCCGQIAYNSGDKESTKTIAKAVIRAFEGFDYVVAPSGSCAGMIRHHYKELFDGDDTIMVAVEELSSRTYELMSFLHDVCGFNRFFGLCFVGASFIFCPVFCAGYWRVCGCCRLGYRRFLAACHHQQSGSNATTERPVYDFHVFLEKNRVDEKRPTNFKR